MKLAHRVFLGYFLVVGLGLVFLMNVFVEELKPGVRQSTEETLVDTANVLAELVKDDLKGGTVASGAWARAVDAYGSRRIDARIGGFARTSANHRVYVTDARGIVVYDSEGKDVGADYSRWNDVYLALRGRYGARSTRADPDDERSSVMHVAAPVRDGDRIIGVVTVAKPNLSVQPFIEAGRTKLVRAGLVLMLLSLAVGLAVSMGLSRSVARIVDYARALSRNERVPPPRLHGELAVLGDAVSTLRAQLDGKSYVEQYVHALTHELKSPLAAIHGAAELLREEMPAAERARFLENIRLEGARLRQIVDRTLDLAKVEQLRALGPRAPVDLHALAAGLVAAKEPLVRSGGLTVDDRIPAGTSVPGDPFLLRQALGNLIDNAIEFSPAGGRITLSAEEAAEGCRIRVHNTGSLIPEFARERIFERFFSLPRPGTGQKSTGLGLSLVREIAALHGGGISVDNHPEGGVVATLVLPRA